MYKICEREGVLFFESQSSGVFILVTSSTMRLNGDKAETLVPCDDVAIKG